MGTKISLLRKNISRGRQSLYLDFYPAIVDPSTGKRTRREFLKMYITADVQTVDEIVKDRNGKSYVKTMVVAYKQGARTGQPKKRILTPLEKKENKEILAVAKQILNTRRVEMDKPEVYGIIEKYHIEQNKKKALSFMDYYMRQTESKIGKNYKVWATSYKYLESYAGKNVTFGDVNIEFCDGYREYLLKTKSIRFPERPLSQNSAHSYFNKFKATLKKAFREEKLTENINAKIAPIKEIPNIQEYLTIEEVNKLAEANCPSDVIKRASLFSILTGLRFSDIYKLTWREILEDEEGRSIQFTQQKTKQLEKNPIPEQAYKLCGSPGLPNEKVFSGLKYHSIKTALLKWYMDAGINKDPHFHSFRHTYVVLQLKAGTDIYTVSKMLGHKNLSTTQRVYAKVVQETKRKTTNKIIIG